ncbi:MAG: HpaII family restriction endonuclease [Bacteroidales bacterium]|jgi:type II restriction enzyme|nr:HpaII family restriction endonuclease [Bacteroidales bacterium]MCK9498252.1 HpaII family restriction endonuclease [Bacteroidales bacterium]MDY0313454.1 HpaII family restriction endonuclease [Bacteroidales bacterium]NLB86132.1 HpaII family restriction endonuclease [Bacteroidales bacterium]
MITGNKGEWSEIYTLLKILADKEIYAGDGDLNKIEDLIFPVIRILRYETNLNFEFSYDNDIVVIKNEKEVFRITTKTFQEQAQNLLSILQSKTERTFSIIETEKFLNSFNSHSIKAKSTTKSDIRIVIHDQRTGTTPELGFSIKSRLGSPSTLLNAGKTTNFIYKIDNSSFSIEEISQINAINSKRKIQDRIERIYKLKGVLKFVKTESEIFSNNLTLIDTALPLILSEILLSFYSSNNTKTSDLVSSVASMNPIQYNIENNHPFYEYKIKRLLTDVALGMMPSKVWTGAVDATGGYLIVKENGDVLCYHIYNRNDFENYLYKHTKLDTASSTRHEFGTIYEQDGQLFFKLNLQIRFL